MAGLGDQEHEQDGGDRMAEGGRGMLEEGGGDGVRGLAFPQGVAHGSAPGHPIS